jgi:hypothetical protein
MERESGIGREESGWRDGPDPDDELEMYLDTLPIAPGIQHVDDDTEEADRRAEADFAAGRCVPHERVAAWISKLGTPDEEPMPPEWLA